MKDFRIIISCAILLMVFILTPVHADSDNGFLKQIGYTTSVTFTNTVYGNSTLYNVEGNVIKVYNITQPGVDLSTLGVSDAEEVLEFTNVPGRVFINYDKNIGIVTISHGFNVYSLTDPLHPVQIAQYYNASSGNNFVTCAFKGDYAYCDGNSKLTTFDITDPTNPTIVSRINGVSAAVQTIGGNYLYEGVAWENYAVTFDISDPELPVQVDNFHYNATSIDAPSTWQQSGPPVFQYCNNTLYISRYSGWDSWNGYKTLIAVGVTDPVNPVYLGARSLGDLYGSTGVGGTTPSGGSDFDGRYLYVGARYGVMGIYDLSMGGIPSLKSYTQSINGHDMGYTEDVSVTRNGKYVFIARNTAGTEIINTSSKTSQKWAGHIAVPTNTWGFSESLIGSTPVLAAAGRDQGSTFWDISDPETLTPSSNPAATLFPSLGNPRITSVAWADNYTYSNSGGNGPYSYVANFTGYEKADGETYVLPYKIFYNAYSRGSFVNAAETQYYTTSWVYKSTNSLPDRGNWTFQIFNITNRWNPTLMGSFPVDDVYVNATLNPILTTYPDIGTYGNHTRAYNLLGRFADCPYGGANCPAWEESGQTIPYHTNYLMYFPGGRTMNISSSSSRVNGIMGGLGLWFINIADPTHPFVEKTYGFGTTEFYGGTSSYNSTSDLLYIVANGKVTILNMKDMNNPVIMGTYSKPGGSGGYLAGMARNGTDLYVPLNSAAGQPDYLCLDASNPYNIKKFDQGVHGSGSGPLYYYNGYLYAGTVFKLIVYKAYPSSSAPPIVPSNLLQQTIKWQSQQPEQQSGSAVIDQTINQLTALWKKTVNYLIRHLSIQL